MSYFGYSGLKDESGVGYGVKHVNNKPRVSSMPYPYDIAEGNIADHWPWSKMGYTPTMNTTESDLWSKAGVYTFCTTAGKWEVVSSDNTQDIGTSIKTGTTTGGSTTSIEDSGVDFEAATAVAIGDCVILDKSGSSPEYGFVTAVATHALTVAGGFSSGGSGTGGRAYAVVDKSAYTGAMVVNIGYLTSAFAEKNEIVILNGTTPVDTVNTDLYRVNSFRMIFAGSDAKPKGNLTLRADGGTPDYGFITAGYTRSRAMIYTVPVNKTLYVTDVNWSYGYSTNQTHYARLYTRATSNNGFITQGIFYPCTECVLSNSAATIHLTFPVKLTTGIDLKVSGIATYSGIAQVTMRGWLET